MDTGRFRQYPVAREYMSPAPYTIGRTQPLAVAAEMMRRHQVRHLPVLEGGEPVGVISERDILMVEILDGVDPQVVKVEEAMSLTLYTTQPDAPLAEVVQQMVERKLGSLVVVEGGKVAGVLTTIDALRALLDQLQAKS